MIFLLLWLFFWFCLDFTATGLLLSLFASAVLTGVGMYWAKFTSGDE